MKNLLLPKFLKISTAGKVEWELNVPDHGELTAIAATDSVYSLGKHIIDRFNRSDASISKTSLNGEFICNKTYGNPSRGEYILLGSDGAVTS